MRSLFRQLDDEWVRFAGNRETPRALAARAIIEPDLAPFTSVAAVLSLTEEPDHSDPTGRVLVALPRLAHRDLRAEVVGAAGTMRTAAALIRHTRVLDVAFEVITGETGRCSQTLRQDRRRSEHCLKALAGGRPA